MNLTPEQFAATRKALRAYDPKGTENLSDEHLDGVALSVVLAVATSAPDQPSGDVKKLPTDEMVKIGAEVLRNWWADPLNVLARKAWDAMEAARPKAAPATTPFCRECGAELGLAHKDGCPHFRFANHGLALVEKGQCFDLHNVKVVGSARPKEEPKAETAAEPKPFCRYCGGSLFDGHFGNCIYEGPVQLAQCERPASEPGAPAARAHEREKGPRVDELLGRRQGKSWAQREFMLAALGNAFDGLQVGDTLTVQRSQHSTTIKVDRDLRIGVDMGGPDHRYPL